MAPPDPWLVFEIDGPLIGEVALPADAEPGEREAMARKALGPTSRPIHLAFKPAYDRQQARFERWALHPGRLRRTAFRMAGRAVLLTPEPGVEAVSVRPRILWSGGRFNAFQHSAGHVLPSPWPGAEQDKERAERLVLAVLAGPIADGRAAGKVGWRRPAMTSFVEADLELVARLIPACFDREPPRPEGSVLEALTQRAAQEVEALWPSIEAVADLLVARLEVDGRAVFEMMEMAQPMSRA